MIRSKQDYMFYLEEDRKALHRKRKRPKLFGDEVWKFQRLLRKLEYYTNCKHSLMDRIYRLYLKYAFHKLAMKCGFIIGLNVFGPGLSIAHYGPVIVNGRVRVGSNCRIHPGVTIGAKAGASRPEDQVAPRIGNFVYIAPGAKLFGDIEIADGIAIGANAVVNKSFLEPNISIGGIPASKISAKGSANITGQRGGIMVMQESGSAS